MWLWVLVCRVGEAGYSVVHCSRKILGGLDIIDFFFLHVSGTVCSVTCVRGRLHGGFHPRMKLILGWVLLGSYTCAYKCLYDEPGKKLILGQLSTRSKWPSWNLSRDENAYNSPCKQPAISSRDGHRRFSENLRKPWENVHESPPWKFQIK